MATDEEGFLRAVEEGLKLAKRIHPGVDERHLSAAPRPAGAMERAAAAAASAPVVCAVISDPGIVDNPDIPSYQPYVYGKCDPPVLIPLHMSAITVEVDCALDHAVIAVRGRWRVHCVTRSRSCDCRLVLPMAEQGSILGVEIEVGTRFLSTQVVERDDAHNMKKLVNNEDGGFLNPRLFWLTIPEVNGGSDISVMVRWCQKLMYKNSQFSVTVPFRFPEYVTPPVKIFSKKENIQIFVNTGTEKEVLLQNTSHPVKEKVRQVEKLGFYYEADVESWSSKDIYFSYTVHSSDMYGGIVSQSPALNDNDQRNMFCLYLFPGSNQKRKVFRKDVVFVVDVSGSMQGKPLENVKSAISAALSELAPGDSFDIVAFNDELHSFSSCLELATEANIEKANQWISTLVAAGGTDIMHPINEAIGLLASTRNSIPHIFLVTDGAVEDEHSICHTMRSHLKNKGSNSPRISTFGIGSHCNHYFLRMLASIGRGQYDASYDVDSMAMRLQRWYQRASSLIVANISIDIFSYLDDLEVFPGQIPDLSAECPLFLYGRNNGKIPDSLDAKGSLADTSDIVINLKVQYMKDFPFEKVFAKQYIDFLTAESWFSENKQLENKVTKLSIQSSIPSEYTSMVLLQTATEKLEEVKQAKKSDLKRNGIKKKRLPITLGGITIGFGDIDATKENLPPGIGVKVPETFDVINKAVSCCGKLGDCCCCMCFIRTCSKINDQFVIAITQLCTALACLACSECCTELCCPGSD